MAKSAKERKQDQRKREEYRLAEMGAEVIPITMYRGTLAEMAFIKEVGGFEESEEAITVMIHCVAAIIRRDSHEKNNLLKLPTDISTQVVEEQD